MRKLPENQHGPQRSLGAGPEDGGKSGQKERAGVSRREFLQTSRNVTLGAVVSSAVPGLFWVNDAVAAMPVSEGYLLVDTRKCQGCATCMLSCSLVHEGKENLSLARIQVIQNSFADFPHDITLSQCRQCVEPACLEACPTGALHVDREHGNVRRINAEECIVCRACIENCKFTPARPVLDFEDEHAQKCDLCVDTPYWSQAGGPGGKQACVELCPVAALKFTKEIPEQVGDRGYDVNLRGEGWKKLRFSDEPEKLRSDKTGESLERVLVYPHYGKWHTRNDLDAGTGRGEKE